MTAKSIQFCYMPLNLHMWHVTPELTSIKRCEIIIKVSKGTTLLMLYAVSTTQNKL